MRKRPSELVGTAPFVKAHNELLRYVAQLEIVESSTVKPQVSMKGTVLDLRIPTAPGGSSPSVQVFRLSIKTMFDNYFVALDSAGKVYRVAKCPELQNSVLSRTYYGVTWIYGYPRNAVAGIYRYVLRMGAATVSGFAVTETQLICEPYVLGATFGLGTIIYAIKTPTGVFTIAADTGPSVGTPVDYQDMNIGAHAWCRAANQTPA